MSLDVKYTGNWSSPHINYVSFSCFFCKTCFGMYRWRHLPWVRKDPGRGPSIKIEEEKEEEEEEGEFNAAFFLQLFF